MRRARPLCAPAGRTRRPLASLHAAPRSARARARSPRSPRTLLAAHGSSLLAAAFPPGVSSSALATLAVSPALLARAPRAMLGARAAVPPTAIASPRPRLLAAGRSALGRARLPAGPSPLTATHGASLVRSTACRAGRSTLPPSRPPKGGRRDSRASATVDPAPEDKTQRRRHKDGMPWFPEAKVICNGEVVAIVSGTQPEYHVEVWAGNNPAWRGDAEEPPAEDSEWLTRVARRDPTLVMPPEFWQLVLSNSRRSAMAGLDRRSGQPIPDHPVWAWRAQQIAKMQRERIEAGAKPIPFVEPQRPFGIDEGPTGKKRAVGTPRPKHKKRRHHVR